MKQTHQGFKKVFSYYEMMSIVERAASRECNYGSQQRVTLSRLVPLPNPDLTRRTILFRPITILFVRIAPLSKEPRDEDVEPLRP